MLMNLPKEHYIKLSNLIQKHYQKIIAKNDKNAGLYSYYGIYNEFIKTIEFKTHYEKCFEILDKEFINFCKYFFKSILKNNNEEIDSKTEIKKIFIIVPNITHSLAHIEFLKNFLGSFKSYPGIQFFLVSNTDDEKIKKFNENFFTENEIIFIKYNFKKYDDIVHFYQNNNSTNSRYVIWAMPLLIPLWTMLFGKRVLYVSLKFKYKCFYTLHNAIQFNNRTTESKIIGNTKWFNFPLNLTNLNFPLHKKILNKNNIKFFTVNRIEKINNPVFLDTIKSLLIKYPNSTFSYSGVSSNTNIINFFKKNNIEERCKFIGWVDPKNIANKYDIFIDAPYLSGIVSANYFISGVPVVTYTSAESSYINCSHDNLMKRFKIKFSFNTINDIIDYIDKIINDDIFRMHVQDCQLKSRKFLITNQDYDDKFLKVLN